MNVHGLNINPGMVKMQHRSNLLSQMLSGGSLPTVMGAGSARMQAMALMRQFDTFDHMSDHMSALSGTETNGDDTSSNISGTAREQAKALMKNYDTFTRTAPEETEETAEAVKKGVEAAAQENVE